jgi:prepilin-type N-terminal cleavage/methylation domain-containing protein
MTARRRAFTLIELMVVVAIMGILAVIAIPRFADMVDKSKEGYTKGALSTLRSAISVYYADNNGIYPSDDLYSMASTHKYINSIPIVKIPRTPHPTTAQVTPGASTTTFITDAGGWAYVNNPSDRDWGQLSVNCSHRTIAGDDWSVF